MTQPPFRAMMRAVQNYRLPLPHLRIGSQMIPSAGIVCTVSEGLLRVANMTRGAKFLRRVVLIDWAPVSGLGWY
jgi:hypothetical protein